MITTLIILGTFCMSTVMLGLIIYLIAHSRRRSSEILSLLDSHHLTSKTESARIKAEMHTTQQLADEIHTMVTTLQEQHKPEDDIDQFIKTNKLR